jgi:hypothetical protein
MAQSRASGKRLAMRLRLERPGRAERDPQTSLGERLAEQDRAARFTRILWRCGRVAGGRFGEAQIP